ncbi:MAG: Maf family protein [Aeromonas sp.]
MSCVLPSSPPLILASTSRYRSQLLAKLQRPFTCLAPQIDETAQRDETASALVARLAHAKAHAVAAHLPAGLVIGSDQVCELDGVILGKPHTAEAALAQLSAMQGRRVTFYTGLCVKNAASGEVTQCVEPFSVQFRPLPTDALERYIAAEQPLDCAGSFKCEGLGISLFSALEGRDPNALIGLPLIALCELLEQHGVAIP